MRLGAFALVTMLVLACDHQPVRLTTAADARAPDHWLERDGARCDDMGGGSGGSDVRFEVLEAGLGDPIHAGETVRVHYVATLPSGEKAHDTRDGLPQEFVVGSTHTICGFEKALVGMLPGEKRRATVPASLAFGDEGRPTVPPGTDLVFVIDVFLPGGGESGNGAGPARPAGGGGRRR